MTRAIRPMLLLGALAQGCIIYEERFTTTGCEDGDDDCSTWTWTGTGTEPTEPEPTDPTTEPGPVITGDLELTVGAGEPGESLLSSLVAVGVFDLAAVEVVGFERDVEVLDVLHRDDEVVLLLAIDADAEPGLVDVFVQTSTGEGWVLEAPFAITEPGGGGTPTDDTGTGGGTIDTGCD